MINSKYLLTITGTFVAVLLISGIVSTKIIDLWLFTFDGGTLLFPLSYIFGDILTEVYGYRTSRRVIWIGLVSMLLMIAMIVVINFLPANADRWQQSAYEIILMATPRIFLGSIIAYFAGEFVNAFVLAKMKVLMEGKRLWMRTIWSTIIGQAVDTVVFVMIAFYGMMDMQTLWIIILSNYIFKVAVEVILTPITYMIIAYLKKNEQTDVYDFSTNFNPFILK